MEIAIFQIIVLIFSAIFHEYMHGWMANELGDSTAKDAGRLTMNPLSHIDPVGSVLLPAVLVMTGSPFVFGWAKPVPFNPYNLSDKKYGAAKVAIAGPLGNLMIAIFFGLVLRFFPIASMAMVSFMQLIVYINLLLMVFNLVPIPPMDGSKVLMPFLPYNWQVKYASLERYGMMLVLFFVMFGFQLIIPVIEFLFKLIVGI
ncbi:site-2 protease family protein [Candidatus Parcubacteria bacterium]|nr:site-2 protease family protein [Patescibacteria group bacterium]MBU4309488.1 site-2 protease family protein [Patescibacteria group bacterium]MBU4432644.1 site-2 protease family protein [Patescibacteria group bacterium]MBU4577194.1 site-2 protease family protein [Patescibacteria group bacterium]MCG2696842.1 site-2 protease family protein [Candidatus Parcubacteria bacterium]